MAVVITRMDLSAAELRARTARMGDAGAVRRALAIALVMEGASREEAARVSGMDRQTLRDWVHRYNDNGLDGLSNRHAPGRKPVLTEEQEQALIEWVEAGPDLARDGVVRWRRVDLRDRILREFGVTLHERTIGKLLDKHGYCRLTVRPQHPKSDPEAQATFKKTSPNWCAPPSRRKRPTNHLKFGGRTKHVSASKGL
jgi:transposase